MKTIEITDEQYTQLTSGEDVLLKAPSKNKWEPSETGYILTNDGEITNNEDVLVPHRTILTKNGFTRKTKEQAKLSRDRVLRSNKLSAFLAEIGEEKEWVKGAENWYVHNAYTKWVKNYTYEYYEPEKVYMTKSGAKQVCEALNSRYLTL